MKTEYKLPNTNVIDKVKITGRGRMKDGREFYLCRKWGTDYRSFDEGKTWERRGVKP